MTQALTPAERQELLAQIDNLNQRAVSKDRDERALRVQIENLDADIASGKPGAKAAALKLDDEARSAKIEADACARARAAAERRYDDDAPFRAAEAEALRLTQLKAAIEVSYEAAAAADKAAKTLVAALLKHQASLDLPISLGAEPHIRHQLMMQYVFDSVLYGAGMSELVPSIQRSGNGPNSLEEHTRQSLRA